MRKSKIIALLMVVGFSLGCATLIDWGQEACESAVGGSKAGELCEQLDKLREDASEEAPAE